MVKSSSNANYPRPPFSLGKMWSVDSPKAIKAQEHGWLNAILYLAPASTSGKNLCGNASPACIALCLGWFSGQASMVKDLEQGKNATRNSRIAKAQFFLKQRKAFMWYMALTIARIVRDSELPVCFRPNGCSDIPWESVSLDVSPAQAVELSAILQRPVAPGVYPSIMALYPEQQFVDYTKNPRRFAKALPTNYWLTFSRSETNDETALSLLRAGHNVAVVFDHKPQDWHGFPVIDGDEHDLRHLDARGGFVVALSPKGSKAKKDQSGFVVRHIVHNQQPFALAA